MRDCVWLPAHLQFENGGEAMALIPTCYDGSHLNSSGEVQLARKTEWQELRPEVWIGQGQRVLTSESGDHALMDVREITFNAAAG